MNFSNTGSTTQVLRCAIQLRRGKNFKDTFQLASPKAYQLQPFSPRVSSARKHIWKLTFHW